MSGQKIIDGLREAIAYSNGDMSAGRVVTSLKGSDLDLALAIAEFRAALPGWWFSVGECSVSCDASVGPDAAYVKEPELSRFDAGFDGDLRQPSTMAAALRAATAAAVEATNGAI